MSSGGKLPVIACELAALAPEARLRRAALAASLTDAVAAVHELADGYALLLPREPSIEASIRELIGLEARCCPFLEFAIEAAASTLRLTIRGGPGVKEFVAAQFIPRKEAS